MSTILDKIAEVKKEEIRKLKSRYMETDFSSFEYFERGSFSLYDAICRDGLSVIAEVKKASPSKGVIREDFNPMEIALAYQDSGAAAISMLTDVPFFQGNPEYLTLIRPEVRIPLLRKDFILDPLQVLESKALGADAILLIVTLLSEMQMSELLHAAEETGLEVLVELYDVIELQRCNLENIQIMGVNNRNLHTFEVDLHRGVEILEKLPEQIATVSESGLSSAEDLKYVQNHGINAVLIGESFMRKASPGAALKSALESLQEMV